MPEYCFLRRYSGIFSLFQNFFRNIAKIKIVTRIEMSEKKDTTLEDICPNIWGKPPLLMIFSFVLLF